MTKKEDDLLILQDEDLIKATVETLKDILNLTAYARYKPGLVEVRQPTIDLKIMLFIRASLVNLVGNFTYQLTNHENPQNLDNNMESTISDLRDWFAQAKIQQEKLKNEESH